MNITELPFDYLNKIANQLVMISSLLGGFSIAVIANLLVYKSQNRITNTILKSTTIAAGCFLVTLFAMTNIVMKTTEGYPLKITQNDLMIPKLTGFIAFFVGIITLSLVISLSGWTKSKKTGIFTTIVGIITFLMIVINL
ncbi:hypothetical protein [Lutibacter citreus]|uniref:hypothetical protein n=1 Tax=Lutibacter citreus TaxID=2138210 RepID=UPI000DBE692F|nr:hypothetical protein [Lutibacter citreus]